MDLASIVSYMGTAAGGFLLTSPVFQIRKLDAEDDVGAVSVTYVCMQLIQCWGWVVYAFLSNAPSLLVCNVYGMITATYCINLYASTLYRSEHIIKRVNPFTSYEGTRQTVINAIIVCLCFGLIVFGVNSVDHDRAMVIGGVVAGLFAVSMLASPMENVPLILAAKSAYVLSPSTLCCALVNGSLWTLYGLLRLDPFVIIPNGLGVMCTIYLILLLVRFGRKPPPSADAEAAKVAALDSVA